MVLVGLTALSCLIWTYLLFFNGWFWFANETLDDAGHLEKWPSVVAIIPARNEAKTIGDVVEGHLASTYPGQFSINVVDDQSDDGTGQIARALGGKGPRSVGVVNGVPLPEGWSGKLWAVHNGLEVVHAMEEKPDYVLLTDADIVNSPEVLQNLVLKAENENRVLVSVMAHLDARGVWGSLLIPAFIFFFQKLYPFASTNKDASSVAGAAGGCMLVHYETLVEIGGVEAVRDTLIDDCSLAYKLKDPKGSKRSIWLGFDKGVVSLRDNRELSTIWKMVARTAFTQLHFSNLALVGTLFGMFLTYLIAPIAFFTLPLHGSTLAFTLGSWGWFAAMIAYAPTLIRYKKSPLWLLLLPVSALYYTAMTWSSAFNHWRGKGGAWKGRTY